MKRIQEHIDHDLDNGEKLIDQHPEIFKYEEREYNDPDIERHYRLKRLLRMAVKISPFVEDPAILQIITQLLPTEFGIELFKKPLGIPKPLNIYECTDCHVQFEVIDIKDGSCPKCGSKDYVLMD